jgi:hypothetical protein
VEQRVGVDGAARSCATSTGATAAAGARSGLGWIEPIRIADATELATIEAEGEVGEMRSATASNEVLSVSLHRALAWSALIGEYKGDSGEERAHSSIVGKIVATYSSAVITGDGGSRKSVLGTESFAVVTDEGRP